MGFPGYFLIVADFIQWAKDNEIPVGPGRGTPRDDPKCSRKARHLCERSAGQVDDDAQDEKFADPAYSHVSNLAHGLSANSANRVNISKSTRH